MNIVWKGMVNNMFLQILNMSFTGAIVIVFVLFFRLFLKKAPKVFSYGLWSVVLFRLICPFSFESIFSLLPTKAAPISEDIVYMATPKIDTGITVVNNAVNTVLPPATPYASVNPLQIWMFIGRFIWLFGIAFLLIYSLITLIQLKKNLQSATPYKDNIFISENIETAFVMGVFRPQIYLPTNLNEAEREYILLHEQTHIRRFDHIIKLISFMALCLHWFNPLVWAAFFISSRDMEMSCDEAVIKRLGNEVKKDYSSSLLTLTTGRRIVGGTPLAFGEGDTKGRIKNVLNYKRPAFWVLIVTVIIVIGVALGLITNRKEEEVPGFAGVNAIILEIDREHQTMMVEGIDENSVIGDKCFLTWEENSLLTLTPNNEPKFITLDDYSVGDYVVLFIGAVQETYPTSAKATTIQLRSKDELSGEYTTETENLWNAQTNYVGDNSAVGKLIGLLPVPEGLEYNHFKLHTTEQPYTIEIIYSASSETLENLDELAKYSAESTSTIGILQKNALLLLALVDNAEGVKSLVTDGTFEVGFNYGREWADETVGSDVRNYAESAVQLQELVDWVITSTITEPSEEAKPTENAIEDPLTQATHNAILEHNRVNNRPDNIAYESHSVLATEVETSAGNSNDIKRVTVYAMVLFKEFALKNGELYNKTVDSSRVAGSHISTALTFTIGANGEYQLYEYWQPRSGSYHNPDIKSKFPEETWQDALDTQKYIYAHIQSIYSQLIQDNYIDPEIMITSIIDEMAETGGTPTDWRLQSKHNELTYYGDYMLIYAYSRFLEGNQSDEKGKIMETACRMILNHYNEDIDYTSETGQDWFDTYLAYLQQYEEKEGMNFIKENMPKGYLLLDYSASSKGNITLQFPSVFIPDITK